MASVLSELAIIEPKWKTRCADQSDSPAWSTHDAGDKGEHIISNKHPAFPLWVLLNCLGGISTGQRACNVLRRSYKFARLQVFRPTIMQRLSFVLRWKSPDEKFRSCYCASGCQSLMNLPSASGRLFTAVCPFNPITLSEYKNQVINSPRRKPREIHSHHVRNLSHHRRHRSPRRRRRPSTRFLRQIHRQSANTQCIIIPCPGVAFSQRLPSGGELLQRS